MGLNYSQQPTTDDSELHKFYAQIVNIADDELNLYEYRLYGHYKRVCGAYDGLCTETERTTYQHCNMSRDSFRAARASLAAKGYIQIVEEGRPNMTGRKGKSTVIACNNLWPRNFVMYSRSHQIEEMQIKGLLDPEMVNRLLENPSDEMNGYVADHKVSYADPKGTYVDREVSGADPDGLYDDPKKRNNEIKNSLESSTSATPDASTSGDAMKTNAIVEHPMMKYLMSRYNETMNGELLHEVKRYFLSPIKVQDAVTGVMVECKNMPWHWDNDNISGYKSLVVRIASEGMSPSVVSILKRLSHLRVISMQPTTHLDGEWITWADPTVKLCTKGPEVPSGSVTQKHIESAEAEPIYF